MTKENRVENPIKRAAVDLVHMMDYQHKMHEEGGYKAELFQKEYNAFIMDLIKKGYDHQTLLMYGEEYKTLSMSEYFEWRYI